MKPIIDSAAVFEELQLTKDVDEVGTVLYRNRDGKIHRTHGPAAITTSGYVAWYANGKFHRIGGPARDWNGGNEAFFIHGTEYSEEDYWEEVERLKNGKRS